MRTKHIFFLLLSCLPFIYIASEVSEHDPIAADVAILTFFHTHSNEFFDIFFLLFTHAAGIFGIPILLFGVMAYFWNRNMKRAAYFTAMSVVVSVSANLLLKRLFERARPDQWPSIVTEYSYSFPSGHAMASSALILALIYLAWRTKYRKVTCIVGGIFMLLVGVSRIYFGVHFPSDIIAGWVASFAIVTAISSYVFDFPLHIREKKKINFQNSK